MSGVALQEPSASGATQSPAGPVAPTSATRLPPAIAQSRYGQTRRFAAAPLAFHLDSARELGEVWQAELIFRREPIVFTSHPDHAKSLFTAKPADAPGLTGESPLRPILGPYSVLTLVGDQHMRQRKLLLPPFHGEAVRRYIQMIAEVAEREIDRWPVGEQIALAPSMQAVTLDVIMAGIFGIGAEPTRGTVEYGLRQAIRTFSRISTYRLWQLVELRNAGRQDPRGVLRLVLRQIDRQLYAIIAKRRRSAVDEDAPDILSLLLRTHDEEGRPLSDRELRDELLTLVLAGHETTANSLAWTLERLLRAPAAYDRLREATRAGDTDGAEYVDATIHEGMRVRPVVPLVMRMVKRPWQLGHYVVPAQTPVAISIVALHHRPDVYPDPEAFRPERFIERKPGTYTWLPFGGGIRRCLGAELAMAEQRVVLGAIARRTDLTAVSAGGEAPFQRNVTVIPRHGTRVVVRAKLAA
jgi:cytochrome P450